MASKYTGRIKKGSRVYTRLTWGANRGQVDEDRLYSVRAIGPKMCILDRVDKETGQIKEGGWYRGNNYYLSTKEQVESYGSGFWDWEQFLVPAGEEGWDAPSNMGF